MPVAFDLHRHVSRFRRLPQGDDIWEGAVVPLPTWVADPSGGDPYRPQAAIWVAANRHLAHTSKLNAGEAVGPETALAALCEMGTSSKLAGERPRIVRVREQQLANALRAALTDTGIIVETVDDLPHLEDFLSETALAMSQDRIPGALSAPGVTSDRLRAFADAARQFFEAAPWRHLNDGDLIKIEAPKAGPGLDLLAVMGSAGQVFGVGFFASAKQYRQVLERAPSDEILDRGGEWAVYFSPGWEIPLVDLDAWDRFHLPLAAANAYPCAMRLDSKGEPERPDAGRLARLEGVLRAIAMTSEAEMDSGRWSHTVATFDGEQRITLALPDLLEPSSVRAIRDPRGSEVVAAKIARSLAGRDFATMEDANAFLAEQFTGRTVDELPRAAASPLERAQDFVYQAFDARGRRQLHLIREALASSPDCADAYLLLSERSSSADEIRSLLEQAVAAGERALGAAFTAPGTAFWMDVDTRPYMRARAALADFLFSERALDAAIDHYRGLLQLNPNDNQRVRDRLLLALLEANRNDEAGAVLKEADEDSAMMQYSAVLLALRAGDRKLARKRLRSALKANRRVPAYLSGRRGLPDTLPEYMSAGGDDEAVVYASEAMHLWEALPGALAWLRTETRDSR